MWESEVIELDEYTVAVEMDNEENSSANIESLIKQKSAQLKRIDMANIVFPFKRIENALNQANTYLIELRLTSCNIISQECIALAQCNHNRYL